MDSVTTVVSADETVPVPVLDARAIPLELLATDPDARRMVTRVLESMEEPSPVRMFNSAI